MTRMPSDAPAAQPAEQAVRVLHLLGSRGLTLATAESFTGGAVASALVSVPGASDVYVGGVVAYATALKVALLDVPVEVVESEGVVSAACALAMAEGAASRTGADVTISTTGVAGPDSQDGHPPGTMFVACAGAGGRHVRSLSLQGDRRAVRAAGVDAALGLVLDLTFSPTEVGRGE